MNKEGGVFAPPFLFQTPPILRIIQFLSNYVKNGRNQFSVLYTLKALQRFTKWGLGSLSASIAALISFKTLTMPFH